MNENPYYKVKRFFNFQFILSFLVLGLTLMSIFFGQDLLTNYHSWAFAFIFWIIQSIICVLYSFKHRVSKSLLNTVRLTFILLESLQLLLVLIINLSEILTLPVSQIILLKIIKLSILSVIILVMIYLLIKDMFKYKVLRDYVLRDSLFTFIPFAFIIYENLKYFVSSYYLLDNSIYSLFLLNIDIIFIFLKGFLIILLFVKTIYLRNDKKSSFLLLLCFYFSNLNCYIICYFNNNIFYTHYLYQGINLDFVCSILILFSIYYSTLEKEKIISNNLIDDSYMNINNSWISLTIGIFPVTFSVIYIVSSCIINKDLNGLESLIIILLIIILLESRDIILRKDNLKLIASIKKANQIDHLTKIYSRNYFMKKLEKNNGKYALFFVDIKSFKDINNIFGHIAGDKVLIAVANKFKELKSQLGSNILYCRYSDNRFALISKLNQIDIVLEFFDNLENVRIRHNSDVIHVSFNIGYSLNLSNTNLDLIIQEADYALMRAKLINVNDNSILMYNDDLRTDLENINILKKDFKTDLQSNKFSLVFQPKISVQSLKVIGFESLLRWNHDTLGKISPYKFIPIVENLGEISSLDLYVFEKACKFQKKLLNKGFKLICSINLSLNTLKSYDKICKILKLYHSYNIPSNLITVEILENVSLGSNQKTISHINILRSNGISISIDDFGTGYSSLSQISDLYFDELKVPREFVIDARKPNKLAVIEAISVLAKKLNVISVIEGVETYEDFKLFTSLDFDIIQGYYFSKPLNENQFIKYINSSTLENKLKLEHDMKLNK